jgi:hypothetical protein
VRPRGGAPAYHAYRHTWRQGPDVAAADEFLIRRLYLDLIAKPNPHTMIVLTLRRLAPSPQFIDLNGAFVNYCLNDE